MDHPGENDKSGPLCLRDLEVAGGTMEHTMYREYTERENEACHGRNNNCLMLHGKRVSSFFKVMIAKSDLQVLFFPPKFAGSVSHLTDQETYLEDSSGRRWRVTVCNHNGSLAIQQGWPKFSSEHGLNVGDFLVFHYMQGQHFIVQIFGTSACEKIKLCSDIDKGKKRARSYPETTSPVKRLQTTDINSAKKKRETSAASAMSVDESFYMINRDAQCDQGDDRLYLHLSSFEKPANEPFAEGTSSHLKGEIGNANKVETNLRSQTQPNSDVEINKLNSEAALPMFEAGITGTHMVSSPAEDISLLGPNNEKSKLASQFARKVRVVKKEFEETAAEAFCPVRLISGEKGANGNKKVIKSEPADSEDTLHAVSYACQLEVEGRDFQILPVSWRKPLMLTRNRGWWVIYLRGPDKRIWPTVYHRRPGFNVLTSGWKLVTALYGLNPGDECLFELVSQQKCIFDVRKL
ncbi:B3 domain-containing protein Os01g0905400-like isoform X1 [Lycium barbarum]|uniref:B3 domain-containing protein Os01g0905400-like isoform X1 n=2 Tax=Lycium barbarum TaxID=112863 RepID=UPI00293F5B35|nr:B3 domain-containing protein Os01g0905400-like isoform X1 [Lycium barbarum]